MQARQSLSLRADAHVAWQDVRYEDPEPPFGTAYFDTAHARDAALRLELERAGGERLRRTGSVGAELRMLRLESSAIEPRSLTRTDPSAFARVALEIPGLDAFPRLTIGARADRWDDGWIASHDVTLSASPGPVQLHVAQRSAFSPPTASDQFFRSGFAIAPNPDLQPERVPSELEIGASAAIRLRLVAFEGGATAFTGDVDGMIVWAPDFRFVWSPRNRDVKRDGGELWLRAELPHALETRVWAGVARVTYDWPGDADTVQVVYRPRYTGGVSVDWRPGAWLIGAQTLYTGVRYATPGHANPLPAFWDVRVAAAHTWRLTRASITAALRVERLLDNTDSFIHGYPEPGRRFSLELRVAPADSPDIDSLAFDR